MWHVALYLFIGFLVAGILMFHSEGEIDEISGIAVMFTWPIVAALFALLIVGGLIIEALEKRNKQ